MGVNICVQTLDYTDHPSWDPSANCYHKMIWRVLETIETTTATKGHPRDCELLFRPVDLTAFYEAWVKAAPERADHWKELSQILEDPQWWLYISY